MALQIIQHKLVSLIVLDGWGVAPPAQGNAIALAKTPFTNRLTKNFPCGTLISKGEAVGLPYDENGNSEVGHLTLGAGRIIFQDLARINHSIEDGSFFKNPVLQKIVQKVKDRDKNLHLIGLLSNGGVHSHINHLFALLDFMQRAKVEKVFLHLILDGRDTKKDKGIEFIRDLQREIKRLKVGKIATCIGRFYAMDRDEHWDRIKKAYCLWRGEACDRETKNIEMAIKSLYSQGIYDEEMPAIQITEDGSKIGSIQNGDGVIIFNFRPDRAREMTRVLSIKKLPFSECSNPPQNLLVATFTQYDESLPVEVVYKQEKIDYTLAEVISRNHLRQLHIAETEKYAHVTYFFNGYREFIWPGEEHILVPSPSNPDYTKQPEMSAYEITEKVLKYIEQEKYNFILINFANLDMVGHIGKLKPVIKAVEIIDRCVQRITESILQKKGAVIITADHGNAEEILDPYTGKNLKYHTNNPVPVWMVSQELRCRQESAKNLYRDRIEACGMLSDVAPTVLELMHLEKPKEMTGLSLVNNLKC